MKPEHFHDFAIVDLGYSESGYDEDEEEEGEEEEENSKSNRPSQEDFPLIKEETPPKVPGVTIPGRFVKKRDIKKSKKKTKKK